MTQPSLTRNRQEQELLASIDKQLLAEASLLSCRWTICASLARYDIRLLVRLAYDPQPKRRKARRLTHG